MLVRYIGLCVYVLLLEGSLLCIAEASSSDRAITAAKEARLLGKGAVEFLLNYSKKNSLKRKNKKRINSQIFKQGTIDEAFDLFEIIDPVERKILVDNPKMYIETGRIGNMQITLRSSCKSYPNWATIEIYDLLEKSKQHTVYKFRFVGRRYPTSK